MKISIDTKEDSHEEIKKVISMLQNLVGNSQEIFSNDAAVSEPLNSSPIANIFGDMPSVASSGALGSPENSSETAAPSTPAEEEKEEISQSTEDLFAELFSEDELKKMEPLKEEEDEEEELESKPKPKSKKPDIEFY